MSEWMDDNPLAFSGLAMSKTLMQKLASELEDVELGPEEILLIILEIEGILEAAKALTEALGNTTLDDEITELLGGEEQ